jgi:hypothetical protein
MPILERTSQRYGKGLFYLDSQNYDRSLSPRVVQFRLDLRMISDRLERFLGTQIPPRILFWASRAVLTTFAILFISALSQVGLAFPIAYYFHFATVVGVPVNALVVPLTGVLLPSAMLAVALGYISPILAKLPALVASISLAGITTTVHWLGHLQNC